MRELVDFGTKRQIQGRFTILEHIHSLRTFSWHPFFLKNLKIPEKVDKIENLRFKIEYSLKICNVNQSLAHTDRMETTL